MRFINMSNLAHIRRTKLAGQKCIGKGSFASVYAPSDDSPSVTKVTTDAFGYSLLTDYVWFSMREEVDHHFPRIMEDHGDVGESCGKSAYLVEVERLKPVSNKADRRRIKQWISEYDAHRTSSQLPRGPERRALADELHLHSLEFCASKAAQEDEPYRKVFEALNNFLGNYGGALDLKPSNFMSRDDGTLVWNDVVVDAKTYIHGQRQQSRRYL